MLPSRSAQAGVVVAVVAVGVAVASAAPIVPLDTLHLSARPSGRGVTVTATGRYSHAQSAVAVFAQAGTQPCARTWTSELQRGEKQAQTRGPDAAGPVASKELGTGPRTSGAFTLSGSWGARSPAGTYTMCGYLVGEQGAPSTPLATASLHLSIGAARQSGSAIDLRTGDVVFLDLAGFGCYAFKHVYPNNADVKTPPGVNCFLGTSDTILEELGSAALYSPGSGAQVTALLGYGSLNDCLVAPCWQVRHVKAIDGMTFTVPADDIACRYTQRSSLDPAGGTAVLCYATNGSPRVTATGRIANVIPGAATKINRRVRIANAHFDEVVGGSGFLLDHRIAAGVRIAGGRATLVNPEHVCNADTTNVCRHGIVK